jgi:hypothetical protein
MLETSSGADGLNLIGAPLTIDQVTQTLQMPTADI